MPEKPFRLADLAQPAGEVELPGGRVAVVCELTLGAAHLADALAKQQATDPDVWRLARMLIPDLTDEEVEQLTPKMVAGIVAIASGQLAAIMALLESQGNGSGAEGTASPSAPGTTTSTSRPASPGGTDASPTSSSTSRSSVSSGTT